MWDSYLHCLEVYLAKISCRSCSINPYFFTRSADTFFFFEVFGGFSYAVEPLGVLFFMPGKLREMMLRSMAEDEAVVFNRMGLVLRDLDLDLENDLEYGLFKDFFDWV